MSEEFKRYKFSPEELQVLKECNRESLWYRSVPFSSVLATYVYWGFRNGRITGHPRFGPAPKLFGAVCIGYFIGKLSYQSKCVEKIMEQIPDSQLANTIKQGRRGGKGLQESLETSFYTPTPVISSRPTEQPINMDVMDTRPISNFDTESSNFVGFDKQSETGLLDEDELPPKPAQPYSTTYDELRQQNRIDYERQRHPQYSPQERRPPSPAPPPRREQSSAPKSKNIYGDVWDDLPSDK